VARAPAVLVVALVSVRFIDETVAFVPYGALEPIRDDIGLSYAEAGFLLVLYPGAGLLGNGFTIAADYVSRRLITVVGGLGYAAGLLLFATGDSYAQLIVAVIVMGIAGDGFVHGAELALVDLAGPRHDGEPDELRPTLARVNLLASVGDAVGPFLLAFTLAVGLGWRGAFYVTAAMLVVYSLVVAVQPFPPRTASDDDDRHSPVRAVLATLRDRRVLRIGVISALADLFDEPFVGFAIAYLITVGGISPGTATLLAAVGTAGGFTALVVATRRSHTNDARLMATSSVVQAVAVVAFVAVPLLPVQMLAMFGAGAALELHWLGRQSTYLRLRPGQEGTTTAVVSLLSTTAVGFPVLVGVVADARGLTVALGCYAAAAVVLAWLSRSGFERGSKELANVLEPLVERPLGEGVAVEKPDEERHIAEVAQEGAVAGDDELLGVLVPEVAGRHLAVEVVDRPLERRPEGLAEVDAEVAGAVERLPPGDAHEVWVGPEEVERRREDEVEL
jgi:predicted MFS family arabinose efflux permease